MKRGDSKTIKVDGKPIDTTYLGKGMFCTAYRRVDNGRVIVFSIDGEHSKELLSMCGKMPHIPDVSRIDGSADDQYAYEMPYYEPLTTKSKVAWKQYKALEVARQEAYKKYVTLSRPLYLCGYDLNYHVTQIADIPDDLRDAIKEIADWGCNYGEEYVFEFAKRNMCVDEDDRLVLLDPIFNSKLVHQIMEAKRRKARGW